MKSAVARLQATGMFQTTAIRSNAFTSASCGCSVSGSQKKIIKSISPSAILAPICWSPPNGPLRNLWIGVSSTSSSSLPVVPVAYSSCSIRRRLFHLAHSRRSCFLLSWATRAMRFLCPNLMMLCSMPPPFATEPPGRLQPCLLECGGNDLLRLAKDQLEMVFATEALGVDLVDVLRARRPGGEPAIL